MSSKIVKIAYSSDNDDKPQNEEQVTAISIEQAKNALKTLRKFVDNNASIALFLYY